MDAASEQRIADNVKYLRTLFGYSQEKVAEHIHMSRSNYRLYEIGKRSLSTDVLFSLSKLYNVRIETILQLDKERFLSEMRFIGQPPQLEFDLSEIYYRLSPYARGCLAERAIMLLDQEMSNINN